MFSMGYQKVLFPVFARLKSGSKQSSPSRLCVQQLALSEVKRVSFVVEVLVRLVTDVA
jgi:hypothetical protein